MRFGDTFRGVASPILRSLAFRRLKSISFLGILSPRYKDLPLFPIRYKRLNSLKIDESRAHHSLAVAVTAGRMVEQLGLTNETIRYAIAWGLLHDISTWPLSHTGEAAFSIVTDTSSHTLREMMIIGSRRLSDKHSLFKVLKSAELDHEILLALFSKNNCANFHSKDLNILHSIIHSALTPDTIEGMYRSGLAFNVKAPAPNLFYQVLSPDLVSSAVLEKSRSPLVFQLWRAKAKIYENYINTPISIEFESIWSNSIIDRMTSISLADSLDISEDSLIRHSCLDFKGNCLLRYKAPLRYFISSSHSNQNRLKESIPLDGLGKIFTREPMM